MTIPLDLALLGIICLLAWRMKGKQLPHVFLGMVLATAASPGSIIATVSDQGLTIVNSFMTTISGGLVQGNFV